MWQMLIGPGMEMIKSLVDRIPNPAEKQRVEMEMQAQLMKFAADQAQAQIEVNKVEAAHSSIFVAGWRPFVGWMGGVSLGYAFLLQPLLSWILMMCGVSIPLPKPDTDAMMALVTAMLGVTAARSFDKWKGTAK